MGGSQLESGSEFHDSRPAATGSTVEVLLQGRSRDELAATRCVDRRFHIVVGRPSISRELQDCEFRDDDAKAGALGDVALTKTDELMDNERVVLRSVPPSTDDLEWHRATRRQPE